MSQEVTALTRRFGIHIISRRECWEPFLRCHVNCLVPGWRARQISHESVDDFKRVRGGGSCRPMAMMDCSLRGQGLGRAQC